MTTPTTPEQPEPSATPRTDEARATFNEQCDSPVAAEEMAKLERELASTRAANEELREQLEKAWTGRFSVFVAYLCGQGLTESVAIEEANRRFPMPAALSRATTQAGEITK